MPQDLADLGQRGAVPQHVGRQPVAKLVRSLRRRRDPGALQRMPNDGSNRTLTQEAADLISLL